MTQQTQLAYWDARSSRCDSVRPLTEEELSQHAHLTEVVVEAKVRLKLFHLLSRNYEQWRAHLKAMLHPGPRDSSEDSQELDRLMFNFLAVAYGIGEHFRVSYRRRYRRDAIRLKEYDDLIASMCKKSWAFAFFLDYRNFAQHCGLPIGNFQRNEDAKSVSIAVTQDSADLLKEFKDWRYCRLTASHGTLDLIEMAEEYYRYLLGHYAPFIAMAFFPELLPAHQFYGRLTNEVTAKVPGARMIFIASKEEWKERAHEKMKMTVVYPLNDVFGELGIRVNKGGQPAPKASVASAPQPQCRRWPGDRTRSQPSGTRSRTRG